MPPTAVPDAPAVRVSLARCEGSTPREVGAWLAVWDGGVLGSIGGGQLEHLALAHARQRLAEGRHAVETQRHALGASLGQCCGGVVHLRFEASTIAQVRAELAREAEQDTPVALFGAGHVGRAIVRLAEGLPLRLTWVDSRADIFPDAVPPGVCREPSEPVQAAVPGLAAGSHVLIMSFSHAEDFDILRACLARQRAHGDLPFIGLIGSRSKWAGFQHRLAARGFTPEELAGVTSPIGLPGVGGKRPAELAVAVLAQLLSLRAARSAPAR